MTDPYNHYPPNYSSPAPGGQDYPPPGQHYDQSHGGAPYGYPPQHQGYPPPDQSYGQQGYAPQTGQYNDAPAGYGPPQRVNSYGPPQHGGFQHGQQGGQFGAYDASNPQGHAGYHGGQPEQDTRGYGTPSADASHQFPQQGAYNQAPYPADPNNPHQQHGYGDPNAPYDPNAPEGERGLGSSLAGGAAGYFMGKKTGNHGLLGAVGGAILGNYLGDKRKENKHHGQHGGSSGGGSSWGGGKW